MLIIEYYISDLLKKKLESDERVRFAYSLKKYLINNISNKTLVFLIYFFFVLS